MYIEGVAMGAARRHLARPVLSEGARKDLSDALHDLLRRAGRPSTRDIAAALRGLLDPPPSHTRIHDLFTHHRLPDWQLTMCVVEVLACRARGLDAPSECDRFDRLWSRADEELVLDPLAGDSDQPQPEPVPPSRPEPTEAEVRRLLPVTASGPVLPDAGRSRAIFFGTGNYVHLEPLPSVPAGLRDLHAVLSGPAGTFTAGGSRVLIDPRHTTDVLDQVKEASEEAEDTLLVYYSGHGLIDVEGDLSLALPDSRVDAGYTSLQYDWIRRAILNSRAQRKVVILDCCFSGRALGAMSDSPLPLADIEGTVLLTAAAANQVTLAPPGEPHTAFTGELISILHEGIPGGPEVLDIDSIYRELQQRSAAKSRPRPQMQARGSIARMPLARNPQYQPPFQPYTPN
ncbi:caspase domain-containing protein [Streptomyces chartreusis]|uniref:caspase family protein n=1 Tax=Streptomyces chartreusis TaxID=1969 RepID=UPI00368E59BB